ncbi:MAG: hypothetical protein AB7U85_06015 [Alphaproteobacteria bacterium]
MFGFFKKNISDPTTIAKDILKELKKRYEKKEKSQETILSCLGALAGFGCQMAIREGFIKTGKMTEDNAFTVIETQNGDKFFYGDFLNGALLEAKTSVWSLVAGAAQSSGAKELPDIHKICGQVAKNVGSDDFGKITVPKEHQPDEYPIESLKKEWGKMYKVILKYNYNPAFLGWYFALAAQHLIIETKDIFPPVMAVQIVMEAAVSMSKIAPAKVIGIEAV